MDLKRWFGGAAKPQDLERLSIEDLIVLEHYEEATQRLQARLKRHPGDLYAHLKLAEVFTASRRHDDAVEEYRLVAAAYAQDGFYDKGIALLARAIKLRPLDESLRHKVAAYERAKQFEHSREVVIDGLRDNGTDTGRVRTSLELQQLWHNLAASPLVARLGDDQLKRLFSMMSLRRVEAGTVLAERGSDLSQMALVCRGVVEAVIETVSGETVLRSFTVGDLIGEGALLEHRPWPATYRMAEGGTLLTLDREGLERCLMGNPDPRQLLEALREQRHDQQVAAALSRLRSDA